MFITVKKLLVIFLVIILILSAFGCGMKKNVQNKTIERLDEYFGTESSSADTGSGTEKTKPGSPNAPAKTGAEGVDEEFTIYIGGTDEWTPFPGKSDFTYTVSDDKLLDVSSSGSVISFTGLQGGDCVITAELDGVKVTARVRIRAAGGAGTWTIHFDTAAVVDMMGLAVVNYDLDFVATHTGEDMFGLYTGEFGMVYDADLSGLQGLLEAGGTSMEYKTDGWFKNTNLTMMLEKYSDSTEQHFVDSLKDPNITDAERDLINSMMGAMFAGVGSGEEPFEKNNSPVGFWYDWSLHMTEGDLSAYMNMNNAMFSASGSQDAKAQNASAYASAIIVGSFHESQSYENESPFPYQIEVYENGEAVFTLRNPTESPIVVKFYGTITAS